MLRNNNQTAVKRLGRRCLKQNRMRNLFAILAIILTTFMFTSVFSIGFSLGKNMNIMFLRQQGTKTSITLNCPSEEQIAEAKKAKELNAAGLKIPLEPATNEAGDVNLVLEYYNKTEFEENFSPAVSDIKGAYPAKEDELMLSKAGLSALKIKKPTIGMKLTLLMEGEAKSFVLSGWFTDYSTTSGGFHGFVSKKYMDAKGLSIEKNGVLCLSSKIGKQTELYDELDVSVKLDKGQEFETTFDVQEENGSNALVIVVLIGMLGLMIVVSGYLLIYNVMYISVSKDIRFYGLLKTIGTSPLQIKKIVKMQTARLCVWGIPIGILLGTLTSFALVPYALQIFQSGQGDGVMPSDVSFNPLIYVATILFALITVAVSSRKPAKLASQVSAVEALKFNGQQAVKVKEKHSTNGGKLYKMSFRNVFREKKRAVLVFASLFMGTIAFLSVDTFVGSMKLENYVDFYLPNDFTIYTDCIDEEGREEVETGLVNSAEVLAKEISKIEGVTHVWINHTVDASLKFDETVFLPFLKKEAEGEELQDLINLYKNPPRPEAAYSAPIIAVSSEMMEKYNEKARQKIDIERFEKGEICLLGNVSTKEESEEIVGKNITLLGEKGKEDVTLEIGSVPTYQEDHAINIGYYWEKAGGPSCILISDAVMEKLTAHPSVDNILADCDKKAEPFVKKRIKELTRINSVVVATEIKSEMMSQFKTSMFGMNVMGGGISAILILIGVLNFVNVMLTGVFARRGELAVMESVGMTKKQIKTMLVYEGFYYGFITIVLLMTVGNGIIYAVAKLSQMMADYAVFHYPVLWMGILAVLIMIICMFVPSIVYRSLSKESVTERLRMGE
ncbi:MAG: FtsX-like permease family protein [Lachnospira sp.]|nr:FtsX-like permease family protein [Lachnospira sp.]